VVNNVRSASAVLVAADNNARVRDASGNSHVVTAAPGAIAVVNANPAAHLLVAAVETIADHLLRRLNNPRRRWHQRKMKPAQNPRSRLMKV
jgi:ribosome-associated translation inhibitor RaiA